MSDLARVVLDVETYANYFMLGFKNIETGKLIQYELYEGHPLDIEAIRKIMARRTTISFNGIHYDLPMIAAACAGWNNKQLKQLSDSIILQNLKPWDLERNLGLVIPKWDHIDLIEVAPGQASLKIYGGRVHSRRMQDLPIEPEAWITAEQRRELCRYNGNDLDTTIDLYRALEKQIALRERMSEEYGLDLRSKSDAQIAEAVLRKEIEKLTGVRPQRPNIPPGTRFNYRTPDFISFRSPLMTQTLAMVQKANFTVASNGAVTMPKELDELEIKIGRGTYRMGIGGLHSSEKVVSHRADERYFLVDRDVASYYPRIILNCELFPKHLGRAFLQVYRSIVDRRLAAKHSGDKITADSLKITINGSFGKLGSMWSALYSPDLMIQVTITGQLALLMLIERLEENGIRVVSANTDGLVIKCERDKEDLLLRIVQWWEKKTDFETEETRYKALYSRDVNNYIAVKESGGYKGKGAFAEITLQKNPANEICVRAAAEMILNGTPVEETIRGCRDIRQFVSIRTVKGGAEKDGQYLGKAIRWYYAAGVGGTINYRTNGNTVPRSEGAKPLMDLPDEFPNDVDYDWYISEARDLLGDLAFIYRRPKLLVREHKAIAELIG